jgi:hypothetical protein
VKIFVLTCVAFAAIPATAADSRLIVKVTGGQVRVATLDKGGVMFRGIPDGPPPVGEFRWREPMLVRSSSSDVVRGDGK